MKLSTKVAQIARSAGLDRVVDNPRLRQILGAELYAKHRSGAPSAGGTGEKKPAIAEKRSTKSPLRTGPLVSVIIPVYNVQEYLEEAVLSVLNQDYSNVEVILVNDGSDDDSPMICEQLKDMDDRITVIHKENAGLGAARNTGIERANGKYLTFVDSDDIVTPSGISMMVKSLERSGSFFVAGSIERFNSTRSWTPAWVEEVHFKDQQGVTASELPPALYDVFACNKLFRADQWDELVGKFPEGVLYEDQEATAKLYAGGIKFDLLAEVVYRWRQRDDNSSITQNKANLYDLEQRVHVAKSVEKIVEVSPDESLKNYWFTKLLSEDLYYYYREEPRTDSQFGRSLQAAVQYFYPKADLGAVQAMPYDRRLMALALAKGTIDDFRAVLLHFQEFGPYWEDEIDENGNVVAYSKIEDGLSFELTNEERIISPSLLKLDFRVFDQKMNEDGTVSLDVWCALNCLPTVWGASLVLEPYLASSDGDELISLDPEQITREELIPFLPNWFVDQSASVIRINLDPDYLKSKIGHQVGQEMMLKCRVNTDAFYVESERTKFSRWMGLTALQPGELTGSGDRVVFGSNSNGISVKVEEARFMVADAEFVDGRLKLEIDNLKQDDKHWRRSIEEYGLRIEASRGGTVLTQAELDMEGEKWVTNLPLPWKGGDKAKNITAFDLKIVSHDMYVSHLSLPNRLKNQYAKPFFGLTASLWGYASLEKYSQFGIVEGYSFDEGRNSLTVEGRAFFDLGLVRQSSPSFALVNSAAGNIYPSNFTFNGETGAFTVSFRLDRTDARGARVAVPSGSYVFQILQPTGKKLPASVWPRIVKEEILREVTIYGELSRVIVSPTPSAHGMNVRIAPLLLPDSQGRIKQYRLQSKYMTEGSRNLVEAVLFESFGGSAVTDSCLALDREIGRNRPDLVRYWTVKDQSIAVPKGAVPLVQYSSKWWEILSTAKYLVNNNNFPSAFRKASNQVYLQTWHGTPLKRIGNDVPSQNLSLVYRQLMVREAAYWDYFLAQSPWAGRTMSKAFGYEGDVIDIGYPRNSSLFGKVAKESRQITREFFEIEENQTVILYAPTWRDNKKTSSGHYEKVSYLDFGALQKRFGSDVVVLARGHVNTSKSNKVLAGSNVIDVTKYPDLNDLINASDLMVGDYSSVMFDYVNTGKPILFLVPDLEQYSSKTRGFYFNFVDSAPGPLCESTSQLIDALSNLDDVKARYATAYHSYRAKFAPNDSESTAKEVYDLVFNADRN